MTPQIGKNEREVNCNTRNCHARHGGHFIATCSYFNDEENVSASVRFPASQPCCGTRIVPETG